MSNGSTISVFLEAGWEMIPVSISPGLDRIGSDDKPCSSRPFDEHRLVSRRRLGSAESSIWAREFKELYMPQLKWWQLGLVRR